MKRLLAMMMLLVGTSSFCSAQVVIYDLPLDFPDGFNANFVNQDFSDFPDFSTFVVNDAVLNSPTGSYCIDTVRTFVTNSNAGDDDTDGSPTYEWNNGVITMCVVSAFVDDGALDTENPAVDGIPSVVVITLPDPMFNIQDVTATGVNVELANGTYWFGSTATAAFAGMDGPAGDSAEQEFTWVSTGLLDIDGDGALSAADMATIDGAESQVINPGGGFDFDGDGTAGDGAAWQTLMSASTPIPVDMPMQVTGTEGSCAMGACVAPASFTTFRGLVVNADLSDFSGSDDVPARFNPGFTITNTEAPVWLIFDAVAANATSFSVESNAGTPGLTYTVEAFNWAANGYDEIGTQMEAFGTDQTATFTIVPADHVDGAGNVRARVGWRRTSFTINFPWEVRVDQFGFCN